MYNWGYDFVSTQEQYPYETASNYGLWYFLALGLNYIGLGFNVFWILISIFFSASLYLFLNAVTENKIYKYSYILNFILCLILFGYILPWFCFAHVRYGTAILLAIGAFKESSNPKKVVLLLLAVLIHSLIILYILIYYLSRVKFVQKHLLMMLLLLTLIVIAFKDIILVNALSFVSYENYTQDLLQFDFGSSNYIMIFRASIILIVIIVSFRAKSPNRAFLYILTVIYAILAIFTPFSGRFIELLYPNLSVRLKTQNIIALIGLIILLCMEGYFSISRVIFHYDI
jgi:hypothetical protein